MLPDHDDAPLLCELEEGFRKLVRLQRALLELLEERRVVSKREVTDRACDRAVRDALSQARERRPGR